jgi:aryl-alcohol dehydrogenase-like predicted oxidoreductase
MEFPQLSFLKEKLESKEGISMIKKTEKLAALADKLGISLVHLSLAWCLKNPDVSTVILGASNVDQLKENLKTLEFVDYLTSDVLDQIELIVDNSPEKWLEF